MSANIETYIGRESAWHGLGTVVGVFSTWAQILAHGGLDFHVFKSQLRDGLGRPVNAWGTFRWDLKDKAREDKAAARFLGAVGEDYQVIQHARGFEIVDALVQSADGAHYETAGVLGTGEVVWGLADLGLTTRVGDDEHKHYLLFHTGHTGNYATEWRDADTRVVCQNTLNAALSEKTRNKFRIRHTKSAPERIANAQEALQSYGQDVQTLAGKMNLLAGRRVVRESLDKIFDRLFPKRLKEDGETPVSSTRRDNVLAEILGLYESNDNNQFPEQRGSAYNLLNAITNYTDHSRAGTTNRQQSAMFGSGDKLKTSALSVILAESENMPPMRGASVQVDFRDLGLNVPGLRSA